MSSVRQTMRLACYRRSLKRISPIYIRFNKRRGDRLLAGRAAPLHFTTGISLEHLPIVGYHLYIGWNLNFKVYYMIINSVNSLVMKAKSHHYTSSTSSTVNRHLARMN